jgi:hypothetical protein
MKLSRRNKVFGYDVTLTEADGVVTVTVSALEPMKRMFQHHTAAQLKYTPRHSYPSDIANLQSSVVPPEGSPERADYLLMQEKFRSGNAFNIWACRVHPNLVYPTHTLCGVTAYPSEHAYKIFLHATAAELAHPFELTIGGAARRPLAIPDSVIRPFASAKYELGLHLFVDASLGTPRVSDPIDGGAIADGNTDHLAASYGKSVTGVTCMLAAAPIFIVCQRQHLKAPESTAAEIHAAGSAVNISYYMAGILQELSIPLLRPVPIFCDSQSTIFVANSSAAIKRAVWTSRRAGVLRDAVDEGQCSFETIERDNNVADMFTRAVTQAEQQHHNIYMHPQVHGEHWDDF